MLPLLAAGFALLPCLSTAVVTVDSSDLSSPPALVFLQVGADYAWGPLQKSYPDGTYAVLYGGLEVGSFTVAGSAVTAGPGLLVSGSTVTVDHTGLAAVSFDARPLSSDQSVQVRLPEYTRSQQGAFTVLVQDGVHAVTTYAATGTFGTYSTAGGALAGTTGSLTLAGAGVVGFDLSKLTAVHLASSALSSPPGHQLVRFADLSGGSFNDLSYYLPDGTWVAGDYSFTGTYGSFQTAGGVLSALTGAFVAAPGGLGFDLSKLGAVTVPTGGLSSPAGLVVTRIGSVSPGELTDTTFHLPDGVWPLSTYAQQGQFGAFTLSGGALVSASGALRVAGPAAVSFDRSKLTNLRAEVAAGLTTAILDATTYLYGGSGAPAVYTLALGPGTYPLYDYGAGQVFGGFTALGPGLSNLATDARMKLTELQGSTVACVGSAAAPVVLHPLPGTCGALVDSSNAGVCTGAPCTFGGQPSLVLGAGAHAVTVAAGGATCTSYLLVVDVEPPLIALTPQPVEVTRTAPGRSRGGGRGGEHGEKTAVLALADCAHARDACDGPLDLSKAGLITKVERLAQDRDDRCETGAITLLSASSVALQVEEEGLFRVSFTVRDSQGNAAAATCLARTSDGDGRDRRTKPSGSGCACCVGAGCGACPAPGSR